MKLRTCLLGFLLTAITGCSSADLVVEAADDAASAADTAPTIDSSPAPDANDASDARETIDAGDAQKDDAIADTHVDAIGETDAAIDEDADATTDGPADAALDGMDDAASDGAGDAALDAALDAVGDAPLDGAGDAVPDGADATCDVLLRCYRDLDGDGSVAAAGAFDACECPSGSKTISPTGTLFDCNDEDPRVHPGAGFQGTAYCVPGTSCTTKSFDYNCNGSEEKETTGGFPGCSSFGSGCNGQGWQSGSAPACGGSASYVVCGKSGLSCATSVSTVLERCR
jgi:hypothetical protein